MSNEDWNELDESYRSALSGALETAHPAVEQAGGDERAAFEQWEAEQIAFVLRQIGSMDADDIDGDNVDLRFEDASGRDTGCDVSIVDYAEKAANLIEAMLSDRAALAQPSPAQAEQAEVERPEVVAYFDRNYPSTGDAFIWANYEGSPYEPVMTVAQHERIVGARWNRAMDLMGEHVARISEKFKAEREAALARVAELVAALERAATAMWNSESNMDNEAAAVEEAIGNAKSATPVAQAQQLHDLDAQCRDDVARALGLRPSQERGFAWSYLLASIKSCVKASEDAAQAQRSVPEVSGIGRDFAYPRSVVLYLRTEPTDDDLRAIHDSLRSLAAAPGKEGV